MRFTGDGVSGVWVSGTNEKNKLADLCVAQTPPKDVVFQLRVDRVASLNPFVMIDAAALAGATGILLDTVDKQGPGLRGLMSSERLHSWVSAARDARLLIALAGKLTADDFGFVNDAGADIIGVRGAACDGGRMGQIVAARVRAIRSAVARRSTPGLVPDPVSASE